MNYRQKLSYTALGAMIMSIGLGLGAIVTVPLIAQKTDVFDDIQCKSLTIMNENGRAAITLKTTNTSHVIIVHEFGGDDAAIALGSTRKANQLFINGENGKSAITIAQERGGIGTLAIKRPNTDQSASIATGDHGSTLTFTSPHGLPLISLFQLVDLGNGLTVRRQDGIKSAVDISSYPRGGNDITIFDRHGNMTWKAP